MHEKIKSSKFQKAIGIDWSIISESIKMLSNPCPKFYQGKRKKFLWFSIEFLLHVSELGL